MGTTLAVRGAKLLPPLWSAAALETHPGLVRQIHEENVAAGADILTANTFRTHARNGLGERAASATALAVRLAREAARGVPRAVWVAGSLSPLEDCYSPGLVPGDADLEREHGRQAETLAEAGCDLVLAETLNSLREARAALRAAAATGLPVLVSLVSDGRGRLLSGEPLAAVAAVLLDERIPPVVLGLNCVPARRLFTDLEVLARAAPGVPLLASGNTGRARDEARGLFEEPIEPAAYAREAAQWIRLGARIVGGCCGTSAPHVAALASLLTGSSRESSSGEGSCP